MKAVVQRVKKAKVTVKGRVTGQIGTGILVLLGVKRGDTEQEMEWIADKCINLRIFEDESGRFNFSLLDIKGEILVVSQFTLLGDCRRGRRPSFTDAAQGEEAEEIYNKFVSFLKSKGLDVKTGKFGAHMDVELINDGPVTLIVER